MVSQDRGIRLRPADGTVSYLPLYPWLVGRLGSLTGDFLLSALIVSNFAALSLFILFYEVARAEGLNARQAGIAVLSLALFPTAFFLIAAYTDALFLALALGAWLSARRKRWFLASLLSGLATLTRLQGALLTPVLGLLWLREPLDLICSPPSPGASRCQVCVPPRGWQPCFRRWLFQVGIST